jgi:hypothetical protein
MSALVDLQASPAKGVLRRSGILDRMYNFSFRDKLRYRWDNLMSKGPGAMILVLTLATSVGVV